jgi:hypothetical protein
MQKRSELPVNKQVHTYSYNTINNKDYHRNAHNLELHNSKPSVAGCIFHNKLTNIKKKQVTTSLKRN